MTDLTTPIAPIVLDTPAKFALMKERANATVLERSVEIDCLVNALLSRSHVAMIGAAGVAKTFLIRTIVALIDGIEPGQYFQSQLGRRADPAQLLGPLSLEGFNHGLHSRITRRRLPEAVIAFVSEFWRAPDAAVDDLLSILNERLFFNGGDEPMDCPLTTLMVDSNEMPDISNPSTRALADRFAFWLVTKPLQGRGNVQTMLAGAADRMAEVGTTTVPTVKPVITLAELRAAQRAVTRLPISPSATAALVDLRSKLAETGVYPSDRRLVACLPIMAAHAYQARRDCVTVDDIAPLAHVLWTKPDELPTVQRLIYAVSSPLDLEALKLGDQARDLSTAFVRVSSLTGDIERKREAIELHKKITRAARTLILLNDQSRAKGKVLDLFDPLSATLTDLGRRCLALVPPPV